MLNWLLSRDFSVMQLMRLQLEVSIHSKYCSFHMVCDTLLLNKHANLSRIAAYLDLSTVYSGSCNTQHNTVVIINTWNALPKTLTNGRASCL